MSTREGIITYADISQRTEEGRAGSVTSAQTVAVLSMLMLSVIVLSVLIFSNQSLRLDEAQSLWQTSRDPIAMFRIIAQDVHVPLYHIMLHYWQQFIGNSVAAARMMSMVFFILLIPAVYITGKRAYSSSVGLFAAVLVAASPFLNWYGNEIRMYSLFALMTVLNQYFFIRIFMDRPSVRLASEKTADVKGHIWLGYILTSVIGMFTHYFFAFNVIAQIIFFVAYRRHFPKPAMKAFLMIALLGVILFVPWLYYVYHLGAAANTQPALSEPTSIDIFNTFSQFLFGFQNDQTNTILLSLWPLVVLLIFLSLRRNQKIEPQTAYLFVSLVMPILLALMISEAWKPIYLTRYLILSLPSLYLLISWVLSTYPKRLAFFLRTALVSIMIVTMAVEAVSAATPVKEDYRDASYYLESRAKPTDVIVLSAPFTIYPFEYYYRGAASVETLPLWDQYAAGPIPRFSPAELKSDAAKIEDSHQTLWLLLSYDQGYEKQVKAYFDTHFQKTDEAHFSSGIDLYAYRLRYDNTSLKAALKSISGPQPSGQKGTLG